MYENIERCIHQGAVLKLGVDGCSVSFGYLEHIGTGKWLHYGRAMDYQRVLTLLDQAAGKNVYEISNSYPKIGLSEKLDQFDRYLKSSHLFIVRSEGIELVGKLLTTNIPVDISSTSTSTLAVPHEKICKAYSIRGILEGIDSTPYIPVKGIF